MRSQSQFLHKIFQKFAYNNIVYCVLKNYEQLPEQPGRDIDLWIKEDDFKKSRKIMFEVAQDLGWDLLATSLRMRFINAGEYYFIKEGDPNQICVLDISPFLHWKGISYLDHRVLSKHIRTHRRGFKVASPGLEAATMIFRGAMSMMGEIKEEYKLRIVECLRDDPQGFLDVLEEPFGLHNAEAILAAASAGKWDYLGQKMHHFHSIIIKRALRRHPFLQLRQWCRYYTAIWRARLSPNHGFFMTLLGPDGAGKTTIARLLVESEAITKLFPRQKYLYRRFEVPWKKKVQRIKSTGVATFELEIRENGSIVPMEPLKAAIYGTYLALEYLTGHAFLRWWKSNTGLVVFDRYFYDYLVFEDLTRCPRWLLMFLARIVPRPDAIIYLKNDAKTIYARKPERSVQEIGRQTRVCDELVAYLHPAYTIQTSNKPEEIVEDIKKIIIKNLRARNSHFMLH
jgi:thymidylate kinase